MGSNEGVCQTNAPWTKHDVESNQLPMRDLQQGPRGANAESGRGSMINDTYLAVREKSLAGYSNDQFKVEEPSDCCRSNSAPRTSVLRIEVCHDGGVPFGARACFPRLVTCSRPDQSRGAVSKMYRRCRYLRKGHSGRAGSSASCRCELCCSIGCEPGVPDICMAPTYKCRRRCVVSYSMMQRSQSLRQ